MFNCLGVGNVGFPLASVEVKLIDCPALGYHATDKVTLLSCLYFVSILILLAIPSRRSLFPWTYLL